MKSPLACLAALLLVSVAFSQTRRTRKPSATAPPAAASERTSWPLETLTVTGNKNYTAAQILSVAGLRIGQTVGKAEFDAAQERLEATGVFDRVGYRFAPAKDNKGFDGTIEVVEMGQMYPLRFEDLPAANDELRAWLKQQDPLFAPKIPATKRELDRYAQWISEYLSRRNYREPVIGKVTAEGSPELTIVFRPAKPRPSIARVKFTDTGELAAGTLQTAMYGVAIGVVYSQPQFRVLLDNTIRPLYEARGMIRVAFPKIETEPVKDVDGIEVTVQVAPGPVYKLGKVAFSGVDTSALPKFPNLESGKPVNFDEVKTAQERIAEALHRGGYLQTSSEVKRDIHDADKTVDLTFQVTPGPQFKFGKLNITGLDIESEPAIRKLWGLQPGKPFNADYPNHFLERVKEQGVFDNLKSTRAETKVDQNALTVDVTLYFNK